jgi:hypothetical protein
MIYAWFDTTSKFYSPQSRRGIYFLFAVERAANENLNLAVV